ncbi:hypothetical protein LMA00_05860 [Burkholderia ambifaria]|uniref:hypothetical protein n=1 Tax=Burkholderia ambifaria TaxID=152480 RepID=UPI001E533E59|nr:hypothetical protein [Burkholderia ambifaria]UEP49837.1 hypothetical protein LMA00_05860 [Burkholderia ambifaria]
MIEVDRQCAYLRMRRQRPAREHDDLVHPRVGQCEVEDVAPDESGRADEQQFHVRLFRVWPVQASRERQPRVRCTSQCRIAPEPPVRSR